MYAIEFHTKIKNGIIQIPDQYKHKIKDNVKVIILADEPDIQVDIIAELLHKPRQIEDFTPLKRDSIYERP